MKKENNLYLKNGTKYQLASIWKRILALIIDLLILWLIFLILATLDAFVFNSNKIITSIVSVSWLIILYIVYPFMECNYGATFGKKMLKIKCIYFFNGNHPSFLRSMLRVFSRSVYITSIIPMVFGIFPVILRNKYDLYYDLFSGVIIVENNYTKNKN